MEKNVPITQKVRLLTSFQTTNKQISFGRIKKENTKQNTAHADIPSSYWVCSLFFKFQYSN